MAGGFDDVLLPVCLWNKVTGGIGWRTTVNEVSGGFELRNQEWQEGRGRWTFDDVGFRKAEMIELEDFHFERRGAARGFLYRDPLRSEETAGEVRQLADGNYQLRRPIGSINKLVQKFDQSSLRIYSNPGDVTESFNLDTSNGVVTITSDLDGRTPFWSGTWYYAVRFEEDQFSVSQPGRELRFASSFSFIEIRLR